ncbi:hypothetical protein VHEMI08453 [[Torrubiella] hemipterigena]|uniref:Extracellular serine-rich protein n=1 Tax=[Torrubiella] hemipterigena TaxID=1531966 RepID=A0A0A1TNI2_9HYPO|nr:hypothetical protein VHEMI08453 [[Torrubiella] hemipterigena]
MRVSTNLVATAALALPGLSAAANSASSTVLLIARDAYDVTGISPGLDAYGIPWTSALIPQTGTDLPVLNSTATHANYGSIILVGSISYDYNGTYKSALTDAQWDQIFAYQANFNIRMVRINEYPGPKFGTTPFDPNAPGCCDNSVVAGISLTDNSLFPSAGLKVNQPVNLVGLYHYPSNITNTNTTTAFAMFEPAGPFQQRTVAAVINRVNGREEMVWFTSWASQFSLASSFLQHSYIHWMTRGLFVGKRKLYLSPQVDDLQLNTDMYYPANKTYKLTTQDLDGIVTWQAGINTRLNNGSSLRLEFGHNGNGNIETATNLDQSEGICVPDYAVEYGEIPDTALEFMKPLGTGVDIWPAEFVTYGWSENCSRLDSFANWFRDTNNLNAFGHISHTFTHEELNNATYHDATREIQFNQAWLKQMGIDKAKYFTADGIIPPAITGLHNGDAIRAWTDNGIKYVVGDNTRPVLRNAQNVHWPLASTVASNGATGIWIIPRYATTIYYNCDTTDCLLREWYVLTQRTSGTFQDLLDDAKSTNVQYLLNLQADPYMFHQANLANVNAPTITVGSQTGKFSLIQSWLETVTQELTRLTTWPIVSLTHDQFANYFIDRMTRDACQPTAQYGYSDDGKTIVSVTVSTNGNTCSVPVAVSIPTGTVTGAGFSVENVGSEPPIVWVQMQGSPVTLTLCNPVTL